MTWRCPSPDCSDQFDAVAALSSHINDEHAGEFQRDDWPDVDGGAP